MYLPRIEPWRLIDVSTQVSEQQAREVAEAAREQEWKLPSFGKELFLGNFRLDLIHPQPKLDAAAVEKGEAFLTTLRTFLTEMNAKAVSARASLWTKPATF